MSKKIILLAGLMVWLLSFCAAAQEGRVIRGIRINGNRNTNKSLILNTVSFQPGEKYSTAKVQESIRGLYDLGLFSMVTLESAEPEAVEKSSDLSSAPDSINDSAAVETAPEQTDSLDLVINVTEFPVLDHYEITGNKKIDEDDIEAELYLHEGQVLSPKDIQSAKGAILRLYEEEGYLLAHVETKLIHAKESEKSVLEFNIEEGKRVKVVDVSIGGTEKIKEKKLKGKMKTKVYRWWRSSDFKEEDLDEDEMNIVSYYKEKGYLDARIENRKIIPRKTLKKRVWMQDERGSMVRQWRTDTLSPEESRSNLHIHFDVYEGNQYHAGIFSFEGNELYKSERLENQMQLEAGEIFNQNKFDFSKWKIQSLYLEEGYIYANFAEEYSYRGDTVDVHFKIIEGKPAYIRRILVKGNLKTREKVVRREIQLFPGSLYRQSKLERSLRNIMYLNYFTDVKHDIKPLEDGNIDLVFNIVEREDIGQVSVGMGYSQRDGMVGTASLSIPNFRGTGQKLDLSLERGSIKQNYSINFFEPWLYDTPTSIGLSLFYREQPYYNEIYIDRGGELRLGRKLKWPDDYFSISGAYQFSKESIAGRDLGTVLEERDGKQVLSSGLRSSLSLRLWRDDTDMPDFPTRGSVLSYNPQFFGGFLGGDFKFIKHRLNLSWNFPAFWKFVFSVRGDVGYVDGTKISRYHLLRAGGVNYDGMIRGYGEGQFGGGLSNGLSMLVYSAAFRFPIIERQFYFSLFSDAGNTFGDLRSINPADVKRSLGAGVRLVIPMLGTMGVDVAKGLDHKEGLEYHFQMQRGF